VTAVVFLTSYLLQPWLQGKPPTQQFAKKDSTNKIHGDSQNTASQNNDSQSAPLSSEELFSQAEATLQKIADSTEAPSPALMLEAVDLLSRILSAEPENAWALLQMAELAFEQRIFDKSAQFYERYLKLTPEDSAVRTRYASALTFSGKSGEALKELDIVLTAEPNNFQALAFSAISNQESGQKEKAQTLLAKAITLAPSDEARDRLLKFSQSLANKENQQSPVQATQDTTQSETPKKLSPERGNISTAFSGLDSFFRNHPIAGPKYVGLEIKGEDIIVTMLDFPMDKMPPMVKDKFANNSALQVKKESSGKPHNLIFVDKSSGTEMHRIKVEN
jgi:tetratricopeptide (TPR) repeat protein